METPFDVEKQLKNIKLKPLTKEESNLLWFKIEQKINQNQESPATRHGYIFPIMNMFKQKFAIPVLLITVLIGSSFATAALADNAKPGDILFPVDLAVEKIQIAFSANAKKNELKIKFSEERVAEAEVVLNNVSTTVLADLESTSSASANNQASGIKGIEQAEKALNTAIDHLQKTKNELSQSGNQVAVAAIDAAINRLTNLAQNHITDLDKVETKIKNNGNEIGVEAKTSSKELKNKFKIEISNKKEGNKGKGGDRDRDDDDVKVKFKINVASKSNDHDNDDNEDEDEDGDKTVVICHIPQGNPGAKHTITVGKSAKKAHIAHGDTSGPCLTPSPTPTPTPTPDTAPPVISNISISKISSTSAGIIWVTDENSDSRTWFSLSSPVNTSGSPSVSSNTLVTNHNLSLVNLTASTTFYFTVGSSDISGNLATSSQSSFVILP